MLKKYTVRIFIVKLWAARSAFSEKLRKQYHMILRVGRGFEKNMFSRGSEIAGADQVSYTITHVELCGRSRGI